MSTPRLQRSHEEHEHADEQKVELNQEKRENRK